jgi:hypothetical protein
MITNIFTNDFFTANNSYPNDDLVQLVDSITFEIFNFKKTTTWANGTPMDSSKVDGFIYFSKQSNGFVFYYKRIFEGSLNVKWFGAKGIGNLPGTFDDTAAIRKSIQVSYDLNQTQSINGDVITASIPIFFPKGHYVISETIILLDGTILRGDSKNNVRIDRKFGTNIVGFTTLQRIEQPSGEFVTSKQVGIENITFTQIGIEYIVAVDSYIKHCNFSNNTDIVHILLKLNVNVLVEDIRIRSNRASTCYGISIINDVGMGPITTLKLYRVWIQYCHIGLYVNGGSSILSRGLYSSSFNQGIIEYCNIGMYLEGTLDNFYINDVHFEQLSSAAIFSAANGTITLNQVWADVGNIALDSSTPETIFQFNNVGNPIYIRAGYKGKVLLYGKATVVENKSIPLRLPTKYQ